MCHYGNWNGNGMPSQWKTDEKFSSTRPFRDKKKEGPMLCRNPNKVVLLIFSKYNPVRKKVGCGNFDRVNIFHIALMFLVDGQNYEKRKLTHRWTEKRRIFRHHFSWARNVHVDFMEINYFDYNFSGAIGLTKKKKTELLTRIYLRVLLLPEYISFEKRTSKRIFQQQNK